MWLIMGLKETLIGYLLYALPKNLVSYWLGKLMAVRLPGALGKWSVAWFARRYNINLNEAERPRESYHCINELFTRKLRAGVRPLGTGAAVHPADSELTQRGLIKEGLLVQVKNWHYSARELLADPEVAHWEGGHYLTYYLCPTDYHRVHAPVTGRVVRVTHVPGALWPVNLWSVNSIPRLFARNERVIFYIETTQGVVAAVMVGATNVGKMTLSFAPHWTTNQLDTRQVRRLELTPPWPVQKGDELGVFNMGSTVVMLYPPGFLKAIPALEQGAIPVKMGQNLVP